MLRATRNAQQQETWLKAQTNKKVFSRFTHTHTHTRKHDTTHGHDQNNFMPHILKSKPPLKRNEI